MTIKDILYDARALIDEYNEDGVVTPDADVATMETNGLRFINMAARQIYKYLKETQTHTITRRKFENLIGGGFNIEEFTGDDQYYPNEDGIAGAKSYFFMATSDFTAYIEEYYSGSWHTLSTISGTITEETAYSGSISPTDSSYPIRLRFSGTTYYTHYNRCLYGVTFKTGYIPRYEPFTRYEMPSDFGKMNEVIQSDLNGNYKQKSDYSWEGFNTLVINNDFEGILKVMYEPKWTPYTDEDDTVSLNNEDAINFITFFTAAHMATAENTDMADTLFQEAEDAKLACIGTDVATEEAIQDVYGGVH